jgi:hypothetical protein
MELLQTILDFIGTLLGDPVPAKLMRQLDILEEDVVIHLLRLSASSFEVDIVFLVGHVLDAPLSDILIDDLLSVHV